MTIRQKVLAKKVGVCQGMISKYADGSRRPTWGHAKVLAKVTGTTPELWLEGSPGEIRNVLKEGNIDC